MKSKKLVNICAILVVLIVVAAAAFCVKSNATVDCAACGGAGERMELICHDCEGAGEDCVACAGKGGAGDMIACADCEGAGQVDADNNYYATWVSLLPPVIAIALALITKEVYSSLFIGIAVGGLFAANFKPISAVDNIVSGGLIQAVSDTAGIFVFLVILGIMVALVNKAGGSAAFGRWAAKNIKSKIGASIATFILGVLIFIDDYFNCLTVGSVMCPVTDKHKISRAKLAYFIDATAAPVCMIAPISSWAAAVSEYAGDGADGLTLFIQAIPYNFY